MIIVQPCIMLAERVEPALKSFFTCENECNVKEYKGDKFCRNCGNPIKEYRVPTTETASYRDLFDNVDAMEEHIEDGYAYLFANHKRYESVIGYIEDLYIKPFELTDLEREMELLKRHFAPEIKILNDYTYGDMVFTFAVLNY